MGAPGSHSVAAVSGRLVAPCFIAPQSCMFQIHDAPSTWCYPASGVLVDNIIFLRASRLRGCSFLLSFIPSFELTEKPLAQHRNPSCLVYQIDFPVIFNYAPFFFQGLSKSPRFEIGALLLVDAYSPSWLLAVLASCSPDWLSLNIHVRQLGYRIAVRAFCSASRSPPWLNSHSWFLLPGITVTCPETLADKLPIIAISLRLPP